MPRRDDTGTEWRPKSRSVVALAGPAALRHVCRSRAASSSHSPSDHPTDTEGIHPIAASKHARRVCQTGRSRMETRPQQTHLRGHTRPADASASEAGLPGTGSASGSPEPPHRSIDRLHATALPSAFAMCSTGAAICTGSLPMSEPSASGVASALPPGDTPAGGSCWLSRQERRARSNRVPPGHDSRASDPRVLVPACHELPTLPDRDTPVANINRTTTERPAGRRRLQGAGRAATPASSASLRLISPGRQGRSASLRERASSPLDRPPPSHRTTEKSPGQVTDLAGALLPGKEKLERVGDAVS